MAKAKRPRTDAQIAAEQRREENDRFGKTMVRHDKASAAALAKVMASTEMTGPEALRAAIVALAKKTGGK